MPDGLSPRSRNLAARMVELLRREYRDGCRNRSDLERVLESFRLRSETLPAEEGRALTRTVRPLLGYPDLSAGERQHRLVQVGRDLARLASPPGAEAPPARTAQAARPPAGVATLNLRADVQFLKGVGPRLGGLLGNLGVKTVGDLLTHFPRRWEDRTRIKPIAQVKHEALETVRGRLGPFREKKPRPGLTILQAPLSDRSGTLVVTWFNQKNAMKNLRAGMEVTVFGKVERTGFGIQMLSPEIDPPQGPSLATGRIVPVYPLTGRLTQGWLRKLQFQVVPTYAPLASEALPSELRTREGMPARSDALVEYHWPTSFPAHEIARRRLAFEELFLLQVQVALRRQELQQEPRAHFYQALDELLEPFLELMPFPPTGAQRRVFTEILEDLTRQHAMNRLLQGDVGSGKTMVAAFAAFVAIRNGFQAALMAPTEILAEQHFKKLQELLVPAGIRVGRLQGSMTRKGKNHTCELLAGHELDLVVGTHALIQEGVEFANLGLVVVDEQHKFGVMQRTVLRQKGRNPDLLVMTATPIPRTLALTLYGELEVSRLDEMPPGRQPIRSESVPFEQRRRVYEEIRQEVRQGRQAYIVCPLIDENESLEATAAVEEARILGTEVFPEFSVGLLHGRMKAIEKDQVMEAFRKGDHHILISTTVIEVGVDVPNATFMLVQDADRFGLAQLHQLRGRVGRGTHASRCLFMGNATSPQTQRRLAAIARLSDGFEVAEEDLQIRGPGDYYGVRQAGFPELKVADLLRDVDLVELARSAARELLARDPELARPEHRVLREHFENLEARVSETVH